MESIIKNILNNFERISYVGCEESGEGGLYSASVDYITTTFLTKEEYEEWEDCLNSIKVIEDNFQIYCSYDKSGYNFWNVCRDESNYTFIDIWLSDNFTDDDIDSLYESLREVISKIDEVYFN